MYLSASMLLAFSMAIQQVLYNLYLMEIGFDEDLIGQVAAAVALGVALGGIPAGLLYDRFGGKHTFRLALVGIAFSMVLRALFVQKAWLIIWAATNGAANAVYFVSIFPFITGQSSPRERAHLYGANIAVWTGFMMLGSFFAGLLPGLWGQALHSRDPILDQRLSLLLAAGLSACAILPLSFIRNEDLQRNSPRRRLLPSSQSLQTILRGTLVLFLMGMVIGLTIPFYNVYFRRVFASDDVVIGTLFSLSQVMGLISAFFLPYLVRRFGLILGPSIVLGLNAPFILAVGLPLPFLAIAVAFLFSAGMERLGEAPLMNLIMEAVPADDRGAMSGVRLISSYGAQALAGAIGGWLVTQMGYAWLFTSAAAIQLGAAFLIWLLFQSQPLALETSGSESRQHNNIG